MLYGLRNRGNTVVVVEHDADTLLACDHLLEVGPGPGSEGGELMFSGDIQACLTSKQSSTGPFLSGSEKVEKEASDKLPGNDQLIVRSARANNLKKIDFKEFKNTFIKDEFRLLIVDENGVCDACRTAEIKDNINWGMREKELIQLLDKHRKNDGSYDCLVPGSGGKDSAYQAHILKYKYGMNPLTVTWAPHKYTEIERCGMV